ncbi:MAG: DUF3501 family protein [Polyangiaceae bacterium]|nr:DUF3501 family protein [Polyangiaceae bacterium]
MKPIQRSEILPLGEYELVRERFRVRVIEDKRPRRVALGAHLSATFENRDTVLLQIQEMLRTERINREAAVQHEIDTYNELVPGDDELSFTLFVEIPERELRERMLGELAGLEDHVGLEVDGQLVPAVGKRPEAVPDRTTAVHYLKLPLPAPLAARLRSRAASAALVVKHPRYECRTELSAATLTALAEDLGWSS